MCERVRLATRIVDERRGAGTKADMPNLVEYEVVAARYDLSGTEFYSHQTYRGIDRFDERERAAQGGLRDLAVSVLPHPWDELDLELVGLPARWLKPDEDYILWFRFSDARPADVLLGISFVEGPVRLDGNAMCAAMGLLVIPGE